MKKIVLSLFVSFCVLALMSNRSGRGSIFGVGLTTSPGESGAYCGSVGCHFSGAFTPEVNISLLDSDGNSVSKYVPGQTYTVSMVADVTGTPAGYGFQIVSLKDADNSGINDWSDLTSQMQEFNINDRKYIEQNNIINSNTIELTWVAPAEGSGSVSFYGVMNAVNGNGNSGGDGADTSSVTIIEDVMSSNTNNNFDLVAVYPNPVESFINVRTTNPIKEISVIDASGQIMQRIKNPSSTIDASNLSSGFYILNIDFGNGENTLEKIIKI
ncbi:MAG: T9SS type A sorting domain-containing protein [Saprospiraceae bacterium]|nr:T9SS type A sorting domain-containing protein [Bacteroidia bacterium]NNE15945.1 T9SS type A sorting domain-containing protein [Saprospiraceae bacterium]NNL93666.1 T9SS type A sorting domain-containing protein [Saprospiraceae bacterium]